MQVFLETDRLILRRFTADDADLLVELDADPEVMRYINGGEPTSRAEVVDEVLPAFYDRDAGGLPVAWLARMRASLRTLGPRFCATRMLAQYASGPYRSAS